MEKEERILIKYEQADFCQRIYMFLHYPDLRADFQEIDRRHLAPQTECIPCPEKHVKKNCFSDVSLLRGAYSGTSEISMLRNFLRFLKGLKPKRGVA